MGGGGDFIITDKLEMLKNSEIIFLFNNQRDDNYRNIEKGLNELETKVNSIKKGSKGKNIRRLNYQLNSHIKDFEDIKKIDFFSSKMRHGIAGKIHSLRTELKKITLPAIKKGAIKQEILIPHKRHEDYQGRTWVTRKKPFVDRMVSAWLIKKFIDKKAVFEFVDKEKIKGTRGKRILFDIPGGAFTHIGDKCTFEVLMEAFRLKDKTLKEIAKIVHQLDIKDDKYNIPAADGIETLLFGIRKTETDDNRALEAGWLYLRYFTHQKFKGRRRKCRLLICTKKRVLKGRVKVIKKFTNG
ncbi:MAG: chromate resistance protein [Candidatus Mariimomonas ferrooxydans]